MEVLRSAVECAQPLTLHCDGGASVAALVPVDRSAGHVSFRLSEEQRFLRIHKEGAVDLNGGTGPWTEFRAESGSDPSTLQLQAVRSGLWLAVHDGEFASAHAPTPLLPCPAAALALPRAVAVLTAAELAQAEEGGLRMLRSASGAGGLPWPLRIERRRDGNVLLLLGSGKSVAFNQKGQMLGHGSTGVWAQWELEELPGGSLHLRNVGHSKYLALDEGGRATLAEQPEAFVLAEPEAAKPPESLPAVDPGVLSREDIESFKNLGYVIVRGAVPPDLVRKALRAINHQLGKPGCWQADPNHASQLALKVATGSVGAELVRSAPVFWSAIHVLLGEGNLRPADYRPQVALCFPEHPEIGFDQVDNGTGYHIDGMGGGKTRLCPFTLLCGVALSEQSKPNCGNLHVYPGSHLDPVVHGYYRDLIDDAGQGEGDIRKPSLGGSTQVLLKPGDVVIAHQLLAHRVGRNFSEHIRYQLYYRLLHKDHERFKERIINEPWVEYAI